MLTPEQIKKRLEPMRLAAVASRTGLAYHTVRRFKTGELKEPSYQVTKALSDYLLELESI